jgi:hypothetical protein
VETVTRQVWPLEQRVTSGHLGDPEQFLEELFGTRHALLVVSNMATLGHQIYQRMSALGRFIPPECQPLVTDLEDQFDRVAGVADGQIRYLEGMIEFYKARTDTKVTIAAERLALIAVLTLPITALSSVYGMNIIVNDRTDFPHLAVVVVAAAMLVLSAVRLALPGQRRGQCSTLFTWADLNGRPVLTCAAFPRQRWPSGRPQTTDLAVGVRVRLEPRRLMPVVAGAQPTPGPATGSGPAGRRAPPGSWTGPCSTVSTGCTVVVRPSNAASSLSLRRPLMRIS